MNDKMVEKLSDTIKLERFRNKLTQRDMANALKISLPTYIELEKHPYKMTIEQSLIITYMLNWNIYDYINNEIVSGLNNN